MAENILGFKEKKKYFDRCEQCFLIPIEDCFSVVSLTDHKKEIEFQAKARNLLVKDIKKLERLLLEKDKQIEGLKAKLAGE